MHGLPFCPRTGCGLRRASGGVCADGGDDEHDQRDEAEQQADEAAPAPDRVFAILRDVDALRISPHQKPRYQRRRAGKQGKRQEHRDKRQHERSDAQHKREDRGAAMAVHLQRIIDRRAARCSSMRSSLLARPVRRLFLYCSMCRRVRQT